MRQITEAEFNTGLKIKFNRYNGLKTKAVAQNISMINRILALESWEGEFDAFILSRHFNSWGVACASFATFKKGNETIPNPNPEPIHTPTPKTEENDIPPIPEPDNPFTTAPEPIKEPSSNPPTTNEQFTIQPTGNPLMDALNGSLYQIADNLFSNKADVLLNSLQDKIKERVDEACAHVVKKIDLIVNGEKTSTSGVLHSNFTKVLELVNLDIPVFLVGPAGTGKNVLCKQIAEALKLDFYFTGAVSQEYKISGFIDANGVYQETQFYKAFKNGGLFFLDEIDSSIPEVLVALNAAIANRYFDFPNGKVEAHEKFRVIAAGNTFGLGADAEYVGRYQLDAATLDRFGIIEIDYDENIEKAVSQGDQDLVDFVRTYRKVASKCGIRTVCSYRAIERIKLLSKSSNFSLKQAIKIALSKNLRNDDINMMRRGMEELRNNKYAEAFIA